MAPDDLSIGQRIMARRNLLKMSIRHAADRASLSPSMWSRIERDERGADNRFTIAKIARALNCSVADLTGQPGAPTDHDDAAMHSGVWAIRNALIDSDLDWHTTTPPRPAPELAREIELIRQLRLRCDYRGAAPRLPTLLREAHALAVDGADRPGGLRAMAFAADHASFILRYLGYPAESYIASERAAQAADELPDPVIRGLAAWSRAHAATGCGAYDRALAIAERGVADLEPHFSQTAAAEMLGQLHLTCAFALYALDRKDDAVDRVAAAADIADGTGDTDTLGLMFGPTNILLWRIAMEVDGGEPGRAVEIAADTNPTLVKAVSRQAAFYLDTARGLARINRDRDAIRHMLTAERLAPQRVHGSPLAAECVRLLLNRSRRGAGGAELRGLCERMGVAT